MNFSISEPAYRECNMLNPIGSIDATVIEKIVYVRSLGLEQ